MGVFAHAIMQGDELLTLLPQRYPMVMVDAFYGVSDDHSKAFGGLTIGTDNVFCQNGVFAEAGLLEHAAQTAALRIGYLSKLHNRDVAIGFIGTFNKVKIYALPHAGDELHTTITVEYEVIGIILASFVIQVGEKIVAEGQMKVSVTE